MQHAQLKVVIFDVDGTLVDSNDVHARSWVDSLTEQGYAVTFDEIRRRIGMGGDNLLPDVIGKDSESPEGKELSHRRKEIFQAQYRPSVKAFPDVAALFQRLKEAGLKPVISSSSEQDDLDFMLRLAGVQDLAEATTSSSDTKNSKPDPDPIQVALKKAGCAPEQALMVGDSPYDVEAARKAGVGTLAVRCGGFSDEDLKGALAIYDGPADLLAHFEDAFGASRAGLRPLPV